MVKMASTEGLKNVKKPQATLHYMVLRKWNAIKEPIMGPQYALSLTGLVKKGESQHRRVQQ